MKVYESNCEPIDIPIPTSQEVRAASTVLRNLTMLGVFNVEGAEAADTTIGSLDHIANVLERSERNG